MLRIALTSTLALSLVATAAAQSTPFSYTGNNLNVVTQNSTYASNLSVFGTGTVPGFGPAEVRITAAAVRERGLGCGNQLQADITFSFGANDTITFTAFTTTADLGKPVNAVVTGSAGAYQGKGGTATVTLTPANLSLTALNLTVNGSINATGPARPASIAPSGIVPLFSSVPIVQPGSWISIYGNNLANTSSVWSSTNFITDLSGVSVSIGGKPAYIWLVSPRQLNVQVPDIGSVGCVNVIVTTSNGTAQSQITLSTAQPSFSLLDARYAAGTISVPNGTGAYGSGVNSYDIIGPVNSFTYKTRPAKAGEIISLYGVGFGPTAQPVTAGQYDAYPINTFERPAITIGGVTADWVFSGLIAPGLYQMNIKVPSGLSPGNQPLVATVPTQSNVLLFSSFKTQNCADPDPLGSPPPNCAVYVAIQ
ncbi:MAG TPA: IPT/TIG domain-containing protein [Bryobacteraceae bacterium]|nr:IPT/TIG domain-containing protein [Bryobacteraceae bacterium]